ncbi:DUF4168 domain-containing protein [Leptolyngbya sp. FACHB-261]|nr:DUF4168 domain-containing protein [Leptolyngbya sp. FACHB-261]
MIKTRPVKGLVKCQLEGQSSEQEYNPPRSGLAKRLCKGLLNWARSLILGLLLSLTLGSLPGLAQSSSPVSLPDDDPPLLDVVPSASDIPSEKVSQFAQAYLKMLKLMANREPDLRSAETDLDSVEVEHQIEADARTIIEGSGLTQLEYLQLLGLANSDPEFGERITMQLQEIGEEA